MRLTLRTLLAYRDNVLDAKDSSALEQRLKDSATARSISERIDAVVGNSRLSPIPVDAREFGFDPNDVASFLDDTMTSDRLPDMERTCLENSTLLAEVASCHTILARAIAIPVQVSPAFRDRIGGLFARKDGALPASNSTNTGHSNTIVRNDSDHGSIRGPHLPADHANARSLSSLETREALQTSLPQDRRPSKELGGAGIELDDHLGSQVPEYLRGTDQQWLASTIRLVVLILLLGVCVTNAIRPWDRLSQLMDRSPGRIEPPTTLPRNIPNAFEEGLEQVPDSIIVSPTFEERYVPEEPIE